MNCFACCFAHRFQLKLSWDSSESLGFVHEGSLDYKCEEKKIVGDFTKAKIVTLNKS